MDVKICVKIYYWEGKMFWYIKWWNGSWVILGDVYRENSIIIWKSGGSVKWF